MSESTRAPERVFILVSAKFDAVEAQRIRASIRNAATAAVALEFAEVRHYDEEAVSELARELSTTERPVSLRGLPERQYRILRGTAATG